MIRPVASTNHFSLENDLPASVAAIHSSNCSVQRRVRGMVWPP